MGMAIIFKSVYAKVLAALGIEFKNGVRVLSGAVDPSITAVDAPAGSTYHSTLNGKVYTKNDAGSSTNWNVSSEPFPIFATVAAAQASSAAGYRFPVCYIEEKEAFYDFCATCNFPADGDLILSTALGGATRWEMVQKVSRTQGDTGWFNLGGAVLTVISPTTVRLTLSSVGGIAVRSVRHSLAIGNYDYTVSGAKGQYFLYFDDGSGTIKSQVGQWDFSTNVPICIVYWNGTAIEDVTTEYHGIRDTVWHAWAHTYLSAQYKSGLAATYNLQPDNNTDPNDDTTQYLWFTDGVIQDEDTRITVGSGNWVQTLGSALTSANAAILQFQYFNGTDLTWVAAMADRTPFLHAGGNTAPQWNNAGTLQAAVTGNYVVYHYFASPKIDGKSVFARPHTAVFTSLATAQAARPSSLVWNDYNELRHIYSAVFRVNTGWATVPSHGCKLVSLQDFRTSQGGPTAATNPTSHSGLTGLTGPDVHPDTSITNTSTGGALDSAVETNVGLATARLAGFDYAADWVAAASYRVGNRVAQNGVLFSVPTAKAHTSGTFATDWAAGRWYALTPGVVPTYTITTASGSSLPAELGRDLCIPVVGTGSAAVIAHLTPFGTVAPNDGQIYRLVGTSNTATVTYVHNDAAKGMVLNGDCELGKGSVLSVQYITALDRYVEIGRNYVGGLA